MTPGHVHLDVGGRRIALSVAVNPRARSIGIRIPPDGGHPRLTLPSARLLPQGLAFAQARADWIAERLDRLAARAIPFRSGQELPWQGGLLRLARGERVAARREGDALFAGGDGVLFAGRIRRWLIADARAVLDRESRALAHPHALALADVAVGDPRSRWGSCSHDGRIRYSWRLLLAPDFVRASVVAHEVAHLAEPNHGAGFWRLATQLLGTSHQPAREWLRSHGGGLHGYGREA